MTSPVRQSAFMRFWAAHSVGQLGRFVGETALPLVAVTTLAASAFEMGLLTAASTAAFLLIGLPAGVWVDRTRRRPLLIGADLLRAAAMMSIPVAWVTGTLSMAHLLIVALLTGLGTVIFDVAYQSYLPSVVGRAELLSANTRLQSSLSIAEVGGPSIGGIATQLVGAVTTLLSVSLSYVLSALLLIPQRALEHPPGNDSHLGIRQSLREGFIFVTTQPLLRPLTLSTIVSNFSFAMLVAGQVIFLTVDLQLPPSTVGIVLAAGAAGGIFGALSAGSVAQFLGPARALWLLPLLTWPAALLIPLAQPGALVSLFVAGLLVRSFGFTVFNVGQVSIRQTVCPDRLLGRMNATFRFLVWGAMPFGALLGGALGQLLGVRSVLWLACGLMVIAIVPLWLSPLRTLRDLPSGPSEL